jgi:hypothetical protein
VLDDNFFCYPYQACLKDPNIFIVSVLIYLWDQHSCFIVIANIYFAGMGNKCLAASVCKIKGRA